MEKNLNNKNNNGFVVLGIDPGYERLGIAIIEKSGNEKEVLLFSNCFKTDKKLDHSKRLSLVREEIISVCEKWKPDMASVETLFFSKNKKTAGPVAQARGVILETLSSLDIKIKELSPATIKLAVTGNGRATKENIIKMVPLLIKTTKNITSDDEMDAIASALTLLSLKNTLIHNN